MSNILVYLNYSWVAEKIWYDIICFFMFRTHTNFYKCNRRSLELDNMSGNRHIVCARMMGQQLKDIQIKLVRGLLDIVVLQLLRTHPMHGYQIITSLRKNFGVYFGPSTIYPLLCLLEEKGYINSQWNLESACARTKEVIRSAPENKNKITPSQRLVQRISPKKEERKHLPQECPETKALEKRP